MVIAELINILVGLLIYIIVGGICAFVGWRGCEKAHEETFEWCTQCKEYDHRNNCCHRWTKVIREAQKQLEVVYCKDCALPERKECPVDESMRADYSYCSFGERKEN